MKAIVPAIVVLFLCGAASAQMVQVPTVQSCNIGNAHGSASIYLSKRDDFNNTGYMDITVTDVGCDPVSGDGHPYGLITMRFSLSDSSISDMQVTLIEQMTVVGKHTPTTYLSGRCTADGGVPCHFWLTLTDNRLPNIAGTADVVGVLVLDKKGNPLTYGTGPVRTGDVSVTQY
ncbi:MAG TPA: hypothetical protein VEU30_15775 [Thermoanaerobaculia bacterium]|nr:hypothetical protein [Thermoanaerobaculia bacterium]